MSQDSQPETVEDPEIAHQAAQDWAYSVQSRYAEKTAAEVLGKMAKIPKGELMKGELVQRVVAALEPRADIDLPQLMKMLSELPETTNELDDPFISALLKGLFEQLRRTAEATGASGLDKLILKSLPSGGINAFCAKNSWDDFNYMFVDSEVFALCNMASKILAMCLLPMIGKDGKIADVETRKPIQIAKSDPVVGMRAADLFAHTAVYGMARASISWVPEAPILAPASHLWRNMELFVVAHELAHVLCGHFERAIAYRAEVLERDDDQALAFSHADEFEADGVGLVLAAGTAMMAGDDLVGALLAAYLFLKTIELLFAMKAIFGDHLDTALSTHPSPKDRAQQIRELAIKLSGRQQFMARLLTRCDQIFWQISRQLIPLATKMAQQGVKSEPASRRRVLQTDKPLILGFAPVPDLSHDDKFRTLAKKLELTLPDAS